MKGIVWLASYPKSGNTWFRTFLANLQNDGDAPVSINALDEGPIASSRIAFDEAVGYDSGELAQDEIDALRPEVYVQWAQQANETVFSKVHEVYRFLPDGRPLIPLEATHGALYFVRNPLDVCVSYAHHGNFSNIEDVIRRMADAQNWMSDTPGGQSNQLRQKLSSWSAHVLSWAKAPGQRVQVVRYEDMKLRPEETFAAAATFAGLTAEPGKVKKAIEFSRFEELRSQEEKVGFDEKMPLSKSFFRKGEIGSWREVLLPEQARRIIADHRDAMRQFGYLDEKDEPVF